MQQVFIVVAALVFGAVLLVLLGKKK